MSVIGTLLLLSTLKLADLRQLSSVQAPQISPDGAYVAAYVTHRDYDKDKNLADLTLWNVRTHEARKLRRNATNAGFAWSPDGSQIAYLAPADDKPQIFIMPMTGGEPWKLTDEKNGVDDFVWRSDGKAIAYTATPESPNAKAIEHHEDAFNVTEEAWTAEEPTETSQLYTIDVRESAKPHHVGNGKWNVDGGFAYAADGKSIFVTRVTEGYQPNNGSQREIVQVNLGDGHLTQIARLSRNQQSPAVSRDGTHLSFNFGVPKFPFILATAVADSNGRRVIWDTRTLNRAVYGTDFFPDGSLAVIAPDGTRARLYHVTASSAVPYDTGRLNVNTGVSVARNGTIAFNATSPTTGSDLYVLPARAKTPVRLSNVNPWLDRVTIGRHETITWKTRHGLTANGVLIYPPNWQPGKALPLALYIHGGPTSFSSDSFNGFADTLAAHGWFVFMPNYLGSDDEGANYAETAIPHLSSVAGESIEDGLSVPLQRGIIDPKKIAVSGWSAGGLMTSWLITHDTRWAAAVDGAAVDDYLQIAAMSDAKDYVESLIAPKPWVNPAEFALYKEESPLTYADRVRTPTLILSNAGDFRVPTPLSYEFYHAIRATGTPVKFVIWPVNGHFPSDPVRAEDVYRQWEAWLVQYLK